MSSGLKLGKREGSGDKSGKSRGEPIITRSSCCPVMTFVKGDGVGRTRGGDVSRGRVIQG